MRKTPAGVWVVLLTVLSLAVSFSQNISRDRSQKPKRDINAVLAAHDKELLAIPDVVGVYVSTTKAGGELCLKVMLARKNRDSEQKIPRSIEGYPVVVKVTGEIRGLRRH
jgi:hypothetical protein